MRQYSRAWLRHEAESFFRHHAAERQPVRGLSLRIRPALGRFFDRAKQFIRESILAGFLALKGPTPLTEAEERAAFDLHQKQVGYLERFQRRGYR